MNEVVVRPVWANNEVFWPVVGFNLVYVMHYRPWWKWLSKGALGYFDMIKFLDAISLLRQITECQKPFAVRALLCNQRIAVLHEAAIVLIAHCPLGRFFIAAVNRTI